MFNTFIFTFTHLHTRIQLKVTDDSLDLATLSPLGCGVQTGAGAVMNTLGAGAGDRYVYVSFTFYGCYIFSCLSCFR
jgi:Zn-dependent alcohol dehydrogenase